MKIVCASRIDDHPAACDSSRPTGTATLPGSVAVPMCRMWAGYFTMPALEAAENSAIEILPSLSVSIFARLAL